VLRQLVEWIIQWLNSMQRQNCILVYKSYYACHWKYGNFSKSSMLCGSGFSGSEFSNSILFWFLKVACQGQNFWSFSQNFYGLQNILLFRYLCTYSISKERSEPLLKKTNKKTRHFILDSRILFFFFFFKVKLLKFKKFISKTMSGLDSEG